MNSPFLYPTTPQAPLQAPAAHQTRGVTPALLANAPNGAKRFLELGIMREAISPDYSHEASQHNRAALEQAKTELAWINSEAQPDPMQVAAAQYRIDKLQAALKRADSLAAAGRAERSAFLETFSRVERFVAKEGCTGLQCREG
jgi:hypothetical protein